MSVCTHCVALMCPGLMCPPSSFIPSSCYWSCCCCRVRLLVSADGTPFELFERVLSPEDAAKAGGSTHGHLRRDSSSSGGGSGSHGSMNLQHSYSSSSSSSSSGGGGSGPEVVVDVQLAFVKDRAISRLTEMQSIEYQIQYAKQHAPQLVLALEEMQQKEQ